MKKKGRGGRQAKAGRYRGFLPVLMAVLVLGTGCGQETEENRTDIDFTVVEPEKVPEELAEIIQEHREEEMQLTFSDGGGLYAVRGYGKQDTGGYSITVDECAEGEEQIYVAHNPAWPAPEPAGFKRSLVPGYRDQDGKPGKGSRF